MATITDPRAVKFANEEVRPLAEALRALKARCVAAKSEWTANSNAIALLFAVNADILNDGRAVEGVNQLTGLQVTQFIGVLDSVIAAINDQIVSIPCVRPIQIN